MKAITLPLRVKGVCSPPAFSLTARRVAGTVEMLKALADPTRLQMVSMLRRADEPVCICDFTAAFNLSQPTISHHMGKLKEAGLVNVTRQGIWSYYRLNLQLDPKTQSLLAAVG